MLKKACSYKRIQQEGWNYFGTWMEVRHLYHSKKELKWSIVPNQQTYQNRPIREKKDQKKKSSSVYCLSNVWQHAPLVCCLIPEKLTLSSSTWSPPKIREKKKNSATFTNSRKNTNKKVVKQFLIVSRRWPECWYCDGEEKGEGGDVHTPGSWTAGTHT